MKDPEQPEQDDECDCPRELHDYSKITSVVLSRHETLRKGICAMIEPVAKVVAECSTASDAFSQLESLKPKLLIIDPDFEDVIAVELCRSVTARPDCPFILVISNKFVITKLFKQLVRAGVQVFCLYSSGQMVLYNGIDKVTRGYPYCDPLLFELVKQKPATTDTIFSASEIEVLIEENEAERRAHAAIKHRNDHNSRPKISVFSIAQDEARRLNHNFVDTGHLLLALISYRQGLASTVLTELGANIELARKELELIDAPGSGFVAIEIPLTPRARRTLLLAWDEARNRGQAELRSEHILLALISDGECMATRMLDKLQIDLASVSALVLEKLGTRAD